MTHVICVIVNWNGKRDTRACLESLKKTKRRGTKLTAIVVDNGSSDGSAAEIHKAHPWATVIETGKNLGFTGGNNTGIKEAMARGADIVWLLNNDTIVDQDVLSLADAFDDPAVGIAGSKIYFAPGHEYHRDRYSKKEQGRVFWYAGGQIDWDNMYASHRGVDEVDEGQYDTVESTPFVTGCSLAARREVIQKIGLLDDRFFLYLEDLDFCLRARNAGWRNIYYPASVVWHVNAGSTGGAGNPLHEYYLTRNRLLVGMRYAPARTKAALLREATRFLLSGSDVKKQAVRDFLFHKWGKQYEPKRFDQ